MFLLNSNLTISVLVIFIITIFLLNDETKAIPAGHSRYKATEEDKKKVAEINKQFESTLDPKSTSYGGSFSSFSSYLAPNTGKDRQASHRLGRESTNRADGSTARVFIQNADGTRTQVDPNHLHK